MSINQLVISFLLHVILYQIRPWHLPRSSLMHKELEMPPHKLMLPSFTVRGIMELYRLIKRRLNFIIRSPQMEVTRGRRWLSGTVTGAGSELGKAVNALSGGMELLPRKASQCYLY